MPQVEKSWLELRGAQEDLLDEKADAAAHRALVESIATGGALAMFDRNSFVDESWRKVIVQRTSECSVNVLFYLHPLTMLTLEYPLLIRSGQVT